MSEMRNCRDLWIAVLFRAVADAASVMGREQRRNESGEMLDRYRSRDWILGNGADFQEVCSMAGFHPEEVITAVKSGRALRVIRARNQYSPIGEPRHAEDL